MRATENNGYDMLSSNSDGEQQHQIVGSQLVPAKPSQIKLPLKDKIMMGPLDKYQAYSK